MLNRQGFDLFRKETEQALENVAKKYGVNITAGKISYTDNEFTVQLKVEKKSIGGKSLEQVEFEQHAASFGLKPTDYRRAFRDHGGEKMYLVGFNLRAPKFPIRAITAAGEHYKFPRDYVRHLLDEYLPV